VKIPEARRDLIRRTVFERKRATITELANTLAVSEETIRRDLHELHQRGLVIKVHGGAIMPDRAGFGTVEKRRLRMAEEKRRLSQRAVGLFSPGESLMIDGGTTNEIFAEALSTHVSLTVVTNSIPIARAFWSAANDHTVILTGGELRLDTEETLGEIALRQLDGFNADHAVLGAAGISPTGQITRLRIDEQMIARAMAARSRAVTVLADHTKFLATGSLNVCELAQVTNIVTDAAPPAEFQALADQTKTEILVADTPANENLSGLL